jgi:hypothetical protein
LASRLSSGSRLVPGTTTTASGIASRHQSFDIGPGSASPRPGPTTLKRLVSHLSQTAYGLAHKSVPWWQVMDWLQREGFNQIRFDLTVGALTDRNAARSLWPFGGTPVSRQFCAEVPDAVPAVPGGPTGSLSPPDLPGGLRSLGHGPARFVTTKRGLFLGARPGCRTTSAGGPQVLQEGHAIHDMYARM